MTVAAAAPATSHTGHLVAGMVLMTVTLLVVAAVEHRHQLTVRLRAPGKAHLVRIAAAAGAASAGIHLAVVPSHWAIAQIYGAFFAVAGASQLGYSVLIVLRPRRTLMLINAAGNLALVVLWAVTRFVGVPLGPDAGLRERVGVLDLVSVACEVAAVVAGLVLAHRAVTHEYVDVHVPTRDRYMDVHVS